jgi:hypothetical protein
MQGHYPQKRVKMTRAYGKVVAFVLFFEEMAFVHSLAKCVVVDLNLLDRRITVPIYRLRRDGQSNSTCKPFSPIGIRPISDIPRDLRAIHHTHEPYDAVHLANKTLIVSGSALESNVVQNLE